MAYAVWLCTSSSTRALPLDRTHATRPATTACPRRSQFTQSTPQQPASLTPLNRQTCHRRCDPSLCADPRTHLGASLHRPHSRDTLTARLIALLPPPPPPPPSPLPPSTLLSSSLTTIWCSLRNGSPDASGCLGRACDVERRDEGKTSACRQLGSQTEVFDNVACRRGAPTRKRESGPAAS